MRLGCVIFAGLVVAGFFGTIPILKGATPARTSVQFSITQDVGSQNEVFVSGAHRDLNSGGILPWGIKLHWSSGNIWSGVIAIESGAQVTYNYVSHANSTSGYCGSGGATSISPSVNLGVPPAAGPPYSGKLVRYASSWTTANLYFHDITQNGNWTTAPMTRVEQGRTSGESLSRYRQWQRPATRWSSFSLMETAITTMRRLRRVIHRRTTPLRCRCHINPFPLLTITERLWMSSRFKTVRYSIIFHRRICPRPVSQLDSSIAR